jgi:gluconolactonase
MSPFSPLVCGFIVCLLLVAAASAGWPDFNGDWSVDFWDFAIFANTWQEAPGSPNWDPLCDISSTHGDRVINEKDLQVLSDNWLAPLSTDLVAPGATLQPVYTVTGEFFEGATWDPNSQKLYFTKMKNTPYRILRLDAPGSVYVWMNNNSVLTNGTTLGIDGRLLTADNTDRQVRSYRIGISGPEDAQTLCNTSDPPNDLCQLTNGNIYVTCQNGNSANQGVYLLKSGTLTKVNNNSIIQPNGVIASLDETKLYVSESSTADNSKKRWWVFPINSNGTLGTGSIFFKPSSPMVTNKDPDGMTIDERGNLYLTGLGGLYIVSPTGVELMRISIIEQANNLTFGGPDYKTLYIACADRVYSLDMAVHGGE